MNIILLIFSFLSISSLHYAFFSYELKKEPIIINKPKYQKVSLQMAKYEEPKEIIKPKETIKEPEIKKEVFKKPIKKDAKKELVKKKVKKKIIKKKPKKIVKKKKKPIIKKVKKKIVEKKEIKPLKKVEIKEPIKKEVNQISKKEAAQSLIKYQNHKKTYLTKLRTHIDKNKIYPKISKRLNEQGKVIVSFRVLKTGLFKNIRLHKSSGKKRLDKAAIKTIENSKSFIAFTKEINKEYLDLTLPIVYRLN